MKTIRGFILFFIVAILTGCTARSDAATVTTAATDTLYPTNTISPSKTPTPNPSNTPQPTQTPTATPITHIDVPGWLGDPNASVLLIPRGEYDSEIHTFVFINADSGEEFELPDQTNIGGYFWMSNGLYFGMIDFENRTISFLDVKTGDFERAIPLQESFRFVDLHSNKVLHNYFVYGASPDDDQLLITRPLYENDFENRYLSFNGTFIALRSVNNNGLFGVEIIRTSERIKLLPDNELTDTGFSWSPNMLYLAVSLSDKTMRIYDVESGNLIRNYTNANNPMWAPNGEWVLYNIPINLHRGDNRSDYIENSPCISNIFTGVIRCLSFLKKIHAGNYIGNYQWLPDGKSLTYLFYDYDLRQGGICITNLTEFEVSCPTEDIEELNQQAVFDFIVSPNGKYIVMRWSERTNPGTDDIGMLYYAILSVKNNMFIPLGPVTHYHATSLWRPPITY